MLLTALIGQLAPSSVVTSVTAFGLYAGSRSEPSIDASFRMGTLVIVRRAQADGSTVTDVATFPLLGHTMMLRAASRGRIVRNTKGQVSHIELSARSVVDKGADEGLSTYDLADEKSDVLTGWSQSTWDKRHPVSLPRGGFYSLGALEALTYQPTTSSWRVPSPSETRFVGLGGTPRWTGPYDEFTMGSGAQGYFSLQGRTQWLQVRKVFVKGETYARAKTGQRDSEQHGAIALFDASGSVVGYGVRNLVVNDMDNLMWMGTTEDLHGQAPNATAPNPFQEFSMNSHAARLTLTPSEEAAFLRAF